MLSKLMIGCFCLIIVTPELFASYIEVSEYDYSISLRSSISYEHSIKKSYTGAFSGPGSGRSLSRELAVAFEQCDYSKHIATINPFFISNTSNTLATGSGFSDVSASWQFSIPTNKLTIDFSSITHGGASRGSTEGSIGWKLLDASNNYVIDQNEYELNYTPPYNQPRSLLVSERRTWYGLFTGHAYKLILNSYSSSVDADIFRSLRANVHAVSEPSTLILITTIMFSLFFRKKE